MNAPATLLETELAPQVRRAARGDVEAFTRLVEATSSTVCGIAFAIVRDAPASEDIAQDVFLAVWKGLKKLANPRSFLPWLRQLTRNQANDWLRRRYSRRAHREVGEAALAAVSDPRRGVDAAIEERESLRLVAAALEELPDEAREVLVLYYREGRSTAQVARLLGLSEPAVRKRLQRARQDMREDVARRVGRGLEKSAPGAALVTAIVAAATVAAAPASAAVLSAAAARGAAAGGLKLGGLAGAAGALAGIVPGVAGVVLGLRGEFAAALDERERGQLRTFRAAGVANVLAGGLGFVWSARFAHWLAPTAVYAAFMAVFFAMYFLWLPRIAARRLEHQRRTDPEAPARQRRRRRRAVAGFVSGALMGGAGLFFGLWSSGLLPWQ